MSGWSTSWVGPRPSDIVPPPGMTVVPGASVTDNAAASPTNAATSPTSSAANSAPSSVSSPTSTSSSSSSTPAAPSSETSPTNNPVSPTVPDPSKPIINIDTTGSGGKQPDVHSNAVVDGHNAPSSSTASIGGIVGGVFGGLIVALIVVGLFIYRRRRRQHMVFTGKEFGSGAASGLFAANATSTGAAEKGLASAGSDDSMFTRQVTPSNAAYNNSGMGNASSSIAAGAVAAAAAATVAHSHTPGFLHHTTSINRAPSPGNAAAMSGQSSPYGAGARALPPLPTLEIREHRTTSPPPLQISGPVWSPNGSPKPATASSMSNSTTTLDSEPATPHRLRLSNVNARRVSDSYSDLPSPMNNGGHTALRIHTEIEEERVGMDSDDESETDSSQSERSKLPVPESPLTRRLSARKNKRLSYNMGDSFDPTIASAVAAASRIESGEDPSTSSAMTPTLSQMAAAVLNARSSDDLEPLDPPRRSVDASSVASSAPSHFFSPRGPLTAVNEESGDGAEAGSSAPLRDQAEPVDRSTTLSKLMSDNFNPELMFGIPANSNAPRAGRSYSNTTGDEDEDGTENGGSRSRSNRRGSSATIATRFEEPRTPSFVRRDSAFFPQDF